MMPFVRVVLRSEWDVDAPPKYISQEDERELLSFASDDDRMFCDCAKLGADNTKGINTLQLGGNTCYGIHVED